MSTTDNKTETTPTNTNTQPASLKQILERSKLTNSKILSQELPSIERGLDQIEAQSKNLSSKTASSDEAGNIRAHYFLAQGGVNTQVLIKELGTIHLGGLEEHRAPIQDMNVEGYLEQKRTETIIKIIEDGRNDIVKNTEKDFKKEVDDYWHDLMENELKVNSIQGTSALNLTKAKFDNSKIVSAGLMF